MKGDRDAMEQVENCATFKGGLKVKVLEDLQSDSKIGHVIKVRVFSPNKPGKTTDGYSLSLMFDRP